MHSPSTGDASEQRLRVFLDLVFDAVQSTTDQVDRTQQRALDRAVRRFSTPSAVAEIHRAIAGPVFGMIRAVTARARIAVTTETQGFGRGDAPGDINAPLDAAQAAVNGLIGDTLSRQGSPLDLGMALVVHGRRVPLTREALAGAFPAAGPGIAVFIHGLGVTERLWDPPGGEASGTQRDGFGSRLESELGLTPVYVRYNTGRPVAENGKALSALLTELIDAYPLPVESLCLIGHSMGGLVARSAAHAGDVEGEEWVSRLRHVVCIGSPHHGSPHAKALQILSGVLGRVDASAAEVITELLETRSIGIRDLEDGLPVDEDWTQDDPDRVFADANRAVPFVDGVGYAFVAATFTRDPAHPAGRLLGDLLVRMPSACGESPEPARRIPFHRGTVLHGLHHFHLTTHPEVSRAVIELLSTMAPGGEPADIE